MSTMAGTEVSVLFSQALDKRHVKYIKDCLDPHFYELEFHEADGVVLCRSNVKVGYFEVSNWLYNLREGIESINISEIPEKPIEDMAGDFGFVTADTLINKRSERYG